MGLRKTHDERTPAVVVERVVDADLRETARKPREMLREAKRREAVFARVERHDLIDAVAEDEAAVEHRYARLGQRHEFAVQIDDRIERLLHRLLRRLSGHLFGD